MRGGRSSVEAWPSAPARPVTWFDGVSATAHVLQMRFLDRRDQLADLLADSVGDPPGRLPDLATEANFQADHIESKPEPTSAEPTLHGCQLFVVPTFGASHLIAEAAFDGPELADEPAHRML